MVSLNDVFWAREELACDVMGCETFAGIVLVRDALLGD